MTSEYNWFNIWFNTPYYHLLYRNRDSVEAEFFLGNLFSKLNLTKDARLCDLACGKGRHSHYMSKMGFRVMGLDLSENNINEAKKLETPTLKFAVHNMLNPFGANLYDGIFNLFTSFGYFDNPKENHKVLKNIFIALKLNGILVIDFFNAKWIVDNLIESEIKEIDNIIFRINRRIENGRIIKDIRFCDKGKSFHFTEKVQLIFKKDFETMLQNNNFTIENCWGDYELNSFSEETSKRLIFVARKKQCTL